MIVKELFGTQIINASFLFANSNISVKYYSKDFPSVALLSKNHGKRSKKYGTLCGRPKRSLAENGTVRYGTVRTRSADKFGLPSVFSPETTWIRMFSRW
jgi:hypothetical protein